MEASNPAGDGSTPPPTIVEKIDSRINALLDQENGWAGDQTAEFATLLVWKKELGSSSPSGDLSKFVTHEQLEAIVNDLRSASKHGTLN